MSVELKIKSKHLSEEARIIRVEEIKWKRQAKWLRDHGKDDSKVHSTFMSLKDHRKNDVRDENRATFLARAFIAGKAYKVVEQKCHNVWLRDYYIAKRVTKMVNKYHDKNVSEDAIREWFRA